MIETVRTWLTAVAAVTLLLSVVQQLVPPGSLRETASFAGGLILVLLGVRILLTHLGIL